AQSAAYEDVGIGFRVASAMLVRKLDADVVIASGRSIDHAERIAARGLVRWINRPPARDLGILNDHRQPPPSAHPRRVDECCELTGKERQRLLPCLLHLADQTLPGSGHDLGIVGLRELIGDERSEEHTSELQSRFDLVCRLLLEKKNNRTETYNLTISRL